MVVAEPPSASISSRATAPSPPPAYDLDADVAAREAAARERIGTRAQIAVIRRIFVFAGPGGRELGRFRGALAVAEKALDAYFTDRFTTPPERAITVLLFPSATPYEAYCASRWKEACMSPYGFYLGAERTIVMNVGPGIGTLTHELVHPLVEADFPEAPDWLNEGVASLYEQFWFPRQGQIAGGKNWRYPRLERALASKTERELVSIPALLGTSDATFRGEREDLEYAMARYFCQWLDQQGKLWPFYHRFRDTHASDPTGARAFAQVVGTSADDATTAWLRWVRAL